jgi:hypothetical protein
MTAVASLLTFDSFRCSLRYPYSTFLEGKNVRDYMRCYARSLARLRFRLLATVSTILPSSCRKSYGDYLSNLFLMTPLT